MHGKILLSALIALIVELTLAAGAISQIAPPGDAPASGEQTVTLNGARIWFKLAGSSLPGEAPLVYLHGGPASCALDVFDASAHFPYAEQPAQFEHDVSVFLAP